jgi:uncharacterized MAPEG superfamily protein
MHPFDFATPEIRMLWASAALGLVQLAIAFLFSLGARGMPWALGARDEPGRPVGKIGARLGRAYSNYLETFPIFAALVLVANAMDRHSAMTAWGAQLYFTGRVLYVPLYAFGIPIARSLAFGAATAGIVTILLAIWPGT